jgi:two-component system cell cycle sensor histidine kinase/response regulator CckA
MMAKNIPSEISKPQSLRVLMVEDSEDDVLLTIRELKKGGYDPVYERVETSAAMKKALKDKQWDIILCDYKMPKFSGEQAIALLKETNIDIPFIIVSGTIGEETAVECMRLGAQDYIMKDNLSRLCSAIARELEDVETRSKRKQAESRMAAALEALRQSEEKYRTILENIADGYYEVDLSGNFTFFNASMCRILGYPQEEMMGMNNRQFTDKENAKKLFKTFNEVYRTGQPAKEFDWQVIRKKGTKRYIEVSVSLQKNSSGQPIGFRGIARDITERKQVLEEMVRKAEEIADLYNNAPCGYHSLGIDGTILRINDTELKWLEYSRDEVIGKKKWSDFLTPAGCQIFKNTFPILKKQKWIRDIEYELVRKDGSVFPVLLNATAVVDEKGNYVESRSTCFDITERKQAEKERRLLEAELFQSQKMEAIGTLAGGIAHDLNNILGGILGYTELVLTTSITQDHPARKYMDGVLRGIDRASDLVSHINTFSRQEESQRKLIGLGPVIKEALKLIKVTLPAKIEMRQRITDVEKTVFADPTQMHQVVMNLCTNAAHTMKEKGGILEVSLSQVTFGADDAVFHPDLKTGVEYELLIISDTGAGIDPENIGRIFEPFFTTKKPGEGTGLGLSVVYGIIKSHDGVICVESEPGQGSTFRVYIPTINAAHEEKNIQIDEVMPGGSERIMLVDDETALTAIFKSQLEDLGYSVDAHNDPLLALDAFKRNPAYYDLVITDMTMPHMMGTDLAAKLSMVRSDIPVILCTGVIDKIQQDYLRSCGICDMILKPISIKKLAQEIRQVLDDNL